MEDKQSKQNKNEQSDLNMQYREDVQEADLKSTDNQRTVEEQTLNFTLFKSEIQENEGVDTNSDVFIEYRHLLNCIYNLIWNNNAEFDSFVNLYMVKLISRFMGLSKQIALDLKIEKIDINDVDSFLLLIHPCQLSNRIFIYNFHIKAQEMFDRGYLNKIDDIFLEFYNWVEDVRQHIYKNCGEFIDSDLPPTHQLTERLKQIIIQNELQEITQKKQKVEDETDLFTSLEETLDSSIQIMRQIDSYTICSTEGYSHKKLESIFPSVVKFHENENKLHELIEKQMHTNEPLGSKYKKLSQYMFAQTYIAYEMFNYIKQYNAKKQLNIDQKDLEYIEQNMKSVSDVFFEKWRLIQKQFIQQTTVKNN